MHKLTLTRSRQPKRGSSASVWKPSSNSWRLLKSSVECTLLLGPIAQSLTREAAAPWRDAEDSGKQTAMGSVQVPSW